MGNSQWDAGEADAWKVIQFVPGLNVAYGASRSLVYAGKGNGLEAGSSAIQAFTAGASSVLGAGLGPAGAVAGNVVGAGLGLGLEKGLKAAKRDWLSNSLVIQLLLSIWKLFDSYLLLLFKSKLIFVFETL